MTDASSAFRRVQEYCEQYVQARDLPGLAVAVTDRERLLYACDLGRADLAAGTPVRPDTLFEIGSIGKSFTAVLLLQLREAGAIDLHAPVTRYLPWFEAQSRFEPITLHHLLTHTAGIICGRDVTASARAETWALRETETGAPPGAFFHYSNTGYKTLGAVVEAATGKPYGDVLRARILGPLGMDRSHAVITHDTRPRLAVGYSPLYDDRPLPTGAPLAPATWLETDTGDGSIAATAADMTAFVRMLLNRGQGPRGRILSEESFALLTQKATRADDWPEEEYYGYGLDVTEDEGHACLGHAGDMVGYTAFLWADLDAGLGAAALSNGPRGVVAPGRAAVRILRGLEVEPPKSPAIIANRADYAGVYHGDGKTLRAEAEGERLYLRHGGERVPLEAAGQDQFHALHPDFALFLLRFGRAEGRVVEAFHRPDWHTGDGYTGPRAFETPDEWRAYPGHYRSYNPWYSNMRVVLRKGALALILPDGEEQPLVPLENGAFRVGADERLPERLRFEAILNGRAELANLSGGWYARTFTP